MGRRGRSIEDTLTPWGGLLIVAAVPVIGLVALVGCHAETSEGDRLGVVVKFSRKGVCIKTWEGTAILGSTDVPGVGTTWDFTVEDDGPVKEVAAAMDAGRKIRMHYVEYFTGGKMHGDTSYRICKVEEVSER